MLRTINPPSRLGQVFRLLAYNLATVRLAPFRGPLELLLDLPPVSDYDHPPFSRGPSLLLPCLCLTPHFRRSDLAFENHNCDLCNIHSCRCRSSFEVTSIRYIVCASIHKGVSTTSVRMQTSPTHDFGGPYDCVLAASVELVLQIPALEKTRHTRPACASRKVGALRVEWISLGEQR